MKIKLHQIKSTVCLLFHSSQSLMLPMQTGDSFSVLLHEGALRGGDGIHPFITLIGYKVADDNKNEHNKLKQS